MVHMALSTEAGETRFGLWARKFGLSDRAVFDSLRARRGKETPEIEIEMCFHTAPTQTGHVAK